MLRFITTFNAQNTNTETSDYYASLVSDCQEYVIVYNSYGVENVYVLTIRD